MNAISAFGAGMVFGVLWTWLLPKLLHRLTQKPEPAASEAKARSKESTFGHPKPPLSTLRKSIPEPPPNTAWETAVIYDDHGEAFLRIALVDLKTGGTVTDKQASLVHFRSHSTKRRYSEEYRKYPTIATSDFNEHLIGPLVDWAATQCQKVHAGKTYGYRMEA